MAEVAPDFVGQQLDAVFTDIRLDAVKTGMLLTAGVIHVVAEKVAQYGIRNLVVDPVMMSTSGATLMNPNGINIFRRTLLPLALLITPNADEAGALTGKRINTVAEMKQAAIEIHRTGAAHVLIKGGHVKVDNATDVLFDGKEFSEFESSRIATRNTHGTGCVLSASITAYLALGESVKEAVALGKEFVTAAIRNALQIGHGVGPCDPLSLGG